jgi:hypothetical protein
MRSPIGDRWKLCAGAGIIIASLQAGLKCVDTKSHLSDAGRVVGPGPT